MIRILTIACMLVLTAVLIWQWTGWSRAQQVGAYIDREPPGSVAAADVMPALPLLQDLGSLEDYAEVTERPLFVASRRPPAATAEASPEQPNRQPQINLTGVIRLDGFLQAHVRSKQGETLRLSVGDEYQGWRVAEILAEELVMQRESDSARYRLRPPADKVRVSVGP